MFKNDKKIIVVLEGPSGVGKDTIMKGLIDQHKGEFAHVVSCTTREMRSYESQGNPYFFVSSEEFDRLVKSGEIFEHTVRHDTKRGMNRRAFDDILESGKIPIKDCDAVGLKALKKLYGEKVFGVYIMAPKEDVERRLIARGDSPEEVEKRLGNYEEHLKQAVFYDVTVDNIDLNTAISDVYTAIMNRYESLK